MYVITQSGKIVNIERFDIIQREEKGIYAINKRNDTNIRVSLGRYSSEEEAISKIFDLSENIGIKDIYKM